MNYYTYSEANKLMECYSNKITKNSYFPRFKVASLELPLIKESEKFQVLVRGTIVHRNIHFKQNVEIASKWLGLLQPYDILKSE